MTENTHVSCRPCLHQPILLERLNQMYCAIYVVSRMEYEERNRKKEAKEIAVLEAMEKMKEAGNQ